MTEPRSGAGRRASGPRRRAAEALVAGHDRLQVVSAMSPQQPDGLLAALVEVARDRQVRLRILVADLGGRFAFLDDAARADLRAGRLQLACIAGAVPRELSRWVDQVPGSLWDIDRMLASGLIPVDVLVARMHAAGKPGILSYGQMVGYSASAIAAAARVCFEVTPACPGPAGPTVPTARADVVYRDDVTGLAGTSAGRAASPEQATIARQVAALIPDGATIQLGLGMVPEAVIPALGSHRGLRVHSGILPASLAGALGGRAFSSSSGREGLPHVATGVMPLPPRAPSWPADVRLRPVSQTHAPDELARIDGLWAVNSAFEVDLNGQVNAEYVDGVRVACGGGQSDFFRAAHRSSGGASVVAIPSRSRTGRPRIRAILAAPHVVTSVGMDIDYVVTEYGVVRLTGLTAAERAVGLIGVAHPDDRPELSAAHEHGLSGPPESAVRSAEMLGPIVGPGTGAVALPPRNNQ